MKRCKSYIWTCVLILMLAACGSLAANNGEKFYYAIDQNGVICGYAEVNIVDTTYEGRKAIYIDDRMELQIVALGADVTGKYHFEYWIDPATGMYFLHTSDIDQGAMKLGGIMMVDRDTVRIVSTGDDDTTVVALPSGTILQNTRLFGHLIKDFVENGLEQSEHKMFSEVDGVINDVTYTNLGIVDLELVGKTYRALMVNFLNRDTGIKVRLWVDSETGYLLKSSHPMRAMYLADSGVKEMVTRADLDSKLFTKVGVVIPDILNISYMLVKIVCEPAGMWVTPEGLNVPGQMFVGTVEENRIEGVFEISHERYDGTNAPPFPPDFSGVDSLKPHLKATDFIESDAPELVERAHQLTEGSKDSWDAMKRLSRWVAYEIGYDIPGGGTALNTYRTRMGECGSHSNLLAAFCRAVGIPARLAFGCMYVPNYGGGFGQHAWNEVFMGDAGWIPVDATAKEIDYADCGHIRFGALESKAAMFNPDTAEIIDYKVGYGTSATGELTGADFEPYLGKYEGDRGIITVLVQSASLAVDIPGQMVFELKPPNDRGEWFFKLTDAACVSFEKDAEGNIQTLIIDSRQRFPRKAQDTTAAPATEIPEESMPLVGAYALPMQSAEAVVVYDGGLAIDIPGVPRVPLEKMDDGRWTGMIAGKVKVVIDFNLENPGQVSSLTFSQLLSCPRIESESGE